MLPEWLPLWCEQQLGAHPAETLFGAAQVSDVFGLRLTDGRRIVVKARDDEDGRAASCVAAQRHVAERGFPCALPLTSVTVVDGLAVHAEQLLGDGQMLRGDTPDIAVVFARLLAVLTKHLSHARVPPPLPNPAWVRWDHSDPGTWPAMTFLDERDAALVPAFVEETALRATARLLGADLPCVLGHADWETQNLRWAGMTACAVHDWDSLAWLPEAAIAGAASGAFASAETPTLAPLDSSVAFLEAYQDERGRRFDPDEVEVAWAASVWPAAHNARGQSLFDRPPVAVTALGEQMAERLRLAGA